ncbi:MAG: asparaginase [Candidatus Rokubacteria bacterium]|nr:asparaginase [Candidatus Rokubacteria bacterium]
MKRVRVIATGGTIASKLDPATGAARPALTGQELVEALPGLSQAQVTVEQFANVASQALTLEQLLALAKRAREIFERGEADGVVITQGTMTLEESSYLWDLVLDRAEPVVVTGAMRHTSLPGADGSRNLLDAVIAAASDATRGLGVLVCMNGELHAARDVVKTHSLDVDSFQSPDLGPLGFVRSGRAEVHRASHRSRGGARRRRAGARGHGRGRGAAGLHAGGHGRRGQGAGGGGVQVLCGLDVRERLRLRGR